MYEGDAFCGGGGGESVHINHRFNSSGLNLACDGLLLGMQSKGREEIPDEAPP
jgi:hypothetical protein